MVEKLLDSGVAVIVFGGGRTDDCCQLVKLL